MTYFECSPSMPSFRGVQLKWAALVSNPNGGPIMAYLGLRLPKRVLPVSDPTNGAHNSHSMTRHLRYVTDNGIGSGSPDRGAGGNYGVGPTLNY